MAIDKIDLTESPFVDIITSDSNFLSDHPDMKIKYLIITKINEIVDELNKG